MTVERRKFLQIGALGLSALGLGITAQHAFASKHDNNHDDEYTESVPVHDLWRSFTLEPGLVKESGLMVPTPWFLQTNVDLSRMLSPFEVTDEMIAQYAHGRADENPNGFQEVMRASPMGDGFAARAVGMPDMADVSGKAAVVVGEGRNANIVLDFLYNDDIWDAASVETRMMPFVTPPDDDTAFITQSTPIYVTMYGWRLQFRSTHVHSLGSCVSAPVSHFHFDIMRRDPYNPSRYPIVVNLHLGKYASAGRTCFVLWEPQFFGICWISCTPTREQLEIMLKYALYAAAAIAGVAIAAWVVAAIAATASAALFTPLLLL